MNRRHFLKGSAAALASLSILPGWAHARFQKDGWFTGYREQAGQYGAAFVDQSLQVTPVLSSKLRLHDVFLSPNGEDIVAPARRPGDLLWIVRADGDVQTIAAPEDRHYFGHGAFSQDGKFFFIAENDFDNERGVIGVYDAASGYKRIDEFSSNGIGPHEMRLMPDGQHLMIANGGILTHPDTGRAKLNIDTMRPNLSLLSLASGQVVDAARLQTDWHQLSIRHFALTRDGEVVFGVQDQQKPYGERPMVGAWQPGSPVRFFDTPKQGWKPFNGYIGSVAVDVGGTVAAVASPRGGVAAFWNIDTRQVIDVFQAADVCGVSQTHKAKEFVATTGQGKVFKLQIGDSNAMTLQENQHALQFDNHCHAISL